MLATGCQNLGRLNRKLSEVLGTFNVKKIETKLVYVKDLLKSYDVLAVQEHWLFTFQLSNFDNYFNTYHTYRKAVDAENPLPPTQKPRGYVGVAILYRKNLDFKVNKQIHDDSRIVVIEIQPNPHLCKCYVYMPSRNSKGNSKADDKLSELPRSDWWNSENIQQNPCSIDHRWFKCITGTKER